MNNINIFLVRSPFQLLSAIEAKEYFKNEYSILIIGRVILRDGDKLMNSMLSLSKFDKIIKITNELSYIEGLKILLFIRLQKLYNRKINKIFVGFPEEAMFQWICENIYAEKYFIIDDGIHTFALQRDFFSKGNYLQREITKESSLQVFKKNIKKYLFGIDSVNIIKYNLFTCFNIKKLSNQVVIIHHFQYIKKLVNSIKLLNNTAYFYGAPLSEDNIITIENELNLLININNLYIKKDKKLYYIPHPRDSQNKINLIDKMGIKIKYLSNIAEVEPIIFKNQPTQIASFLSTILFTLPKIYHYEEVIAFKIPNEHISSRLQAIEKLYNEYEKDKDIKVISI